MPLLIDLLSPPTTVMFDSEAIVTTAGEDAARSSSSPSGWNCSIGSQRPERVPRPLSSQCAAEVRPTASSRGFRARPRRAVRGLWPCGNPEDVPAGVAGTKTVQSVGVHQAHPPLRGRRRLPLNVAGEPKILTEATPWPNMYRDEADAWLDVGCIHRTGPPYQLKDFMVRSETLHVLGTA